MLEHTKYLYLKGEGSTDAIKELAPKGFKHMRQNGAVNWKLLLILQSIGFPFFQILNKLNYLFNLRSICDGDTDGLVHFWKGAVDHLRDGIERLFTCFFGNLQNLKISRYCSSSYKSFFPALGAEGLVNLTRIKISEIWGMEQVMGGKVKKLKNKKELLHQKM